MTELSEKKDSCVTVTPPAGSLASDKRPASAGGTNDEASAAAPQSSDLANDARPLKIAPAKSADPFFSGRKHFPELDGLRGAAILLVMISHYIWYVPARGNWFVPIADVASKGWVGVDLFFVLSGFLISGILLDSKGEKRYFRNFYARRFLRIFPLYYGFLGATLMAVTAFMLLTPAAFQHFPSARRFLTDQPWLWTYTANLYTVESGRWLAGVGHLWSLSVEEQFYIVWPVAVLLLSPRRFLRFCLGVTVGALVLRVMLTVGGVAWEKIYVLTPCRADAFAMGAVVAVLLRRNPQALRAGAEYCIRLSGAILAAALLLTVFTRMNWRAGASPVAGHYVAGVARGVRLDVLYTVISVFFAGLLGLLALGGPTAGLRRFFSTGFMRACGRYSYGLYVFHFFILRATARLFHERSFPASAQRPLGAIGFIGLNIAISVGLAVISYHCFEVHFLKLKKYFPERAAAAVPPQ